MNPQGRNSWQKHNYMKTIKQTYQQPQISEVRLDSEISLTMQSLPPEGPDEFFSSLNKFDTTENNFKISPS